ncbi:MAG: vitamin B12 dependent-methionine synthase activation domain-containing protein [Desulfurivibrionaceae bacterium]|nr:vitamin B12 dependent-methionine synthase activation domain-containing protein [Desulfurivibrionaceae bacterium]
MQTENNGSSKLDAIRQVAATLTVEPGGEVEVDSDFVERLLGRKQGGSVSRSTRSRIERIRAEVLACMEPRLTCSVYPIKSTEAGRVCLAGGVEFESRKMARTLKGAPWLAGFIATIGPGLDRLIEKFMAKGRMADAYVADAMGSGAIESLADKFHNKFAKGVGDREQSVSLRFSPGYCDWPVSEQPKLFSLIDHEAAGVELGDTSLMSPRKSISAIFGIFDKKAAAPADSKHNPCRSCGKKDCIARRVEETPPAP